MDLVDAVDTARSGHSRIVVYGGGDIVLWCKKIKPEDAVDVVCSGIVVYGGGDIVLWCKKVNPVDTVCSGHSGIVIYGGGDIVFGAKRSNQRTQWMQYTVE